MTASPAAPLAGIGGRWQSLDALRGLTIAAMILVNNPGRWGAKYQYAPLRHAEWHGCTPTDLIFPTFLFVMGAAVVPACGRHLAQGGAPRELLPRLLRRVVALVLLGMLLSAFPLVTFADGEPLFGPLLRTRFPGVLQRIGLCYGVAALLFLYTRPKVQRWVLVGCLLAYWPLLYLPVPGGGVVDLDLPGAQLGAWLDRTLFGEHIWVKGKYDPEGLLSTIPALATALCGVEAGRILARAGGERDKALDLLVLGALLAAGGVVWSWFLPLNKPLWTSSYALLTGGLAAMALGVIHWFARGRGPDAGGQGLLRPALVYGRNALLVFVGSGLLARTLGRLVTVPWEDRRIGLTDWVFRTLLPSDSLPAFASLLYSLLWIGGWYCVLEVCYRRNLVWKV